MRHPFLLIVSLSLLLRSPCVDAGVALLGWNNLGMHCMDSDYSVFSILPPYNTIEAQVVVDGHLVTNALAAGYTVTYQAVTDPGGSFNSTAMGKGNFYDWAAMLYGARPADEMGLAGWGMPGPRNAPQSLLFERVNHPAAGVDAPVDWFRAEGIPLSPYDDTGHKNPYPLMRLLAMDPGGRAVATNDIVLPVSDEMDCRACHASGGMSSARPAAGWAWSGFPERDYRLNILRLHDERQFGSNAPVYAAALAAGGFSAAGLYRSVTADAHPVLCAACHASEALGAASYPGVPSLTASMHGYHAHVIDPDLHLALDNSSHRAACYRCHPGSTTRCLRGAMGSAVAPDGSMAMQCQSCHGGMSVVGAPGRVGWFMEPNCQSCHTGTAVSNNGSIRYLSSFEPGGQPRVPADRTFATTANTPASGLSLFRFSRGHGGLQCEACHGSTHAEFPSSHTNDNLRNIAMQGHAGVVVECATCHATVPSTVTGGPHGMHPVGASWVRSHGDALENGVNSRSQCRTCHGMDYRGSVLSRAQADRTVTAFGMKVFFRGATIGCYTCHLGPGDDSQNSAAAPVVTGVSVSTSNDTPVSTTLPVSGAGAVVRIISQPAQGTVGLSNGLATYFPAPGFVGTERFTYAAYDGAKNSNLATGVVEVIRGVATLAVSARAPESYPAGWPVPFAAVPVLGNDAGPVSLEWDFGDGSPADTAPAVRHTYRAPGTYHWRLRCAGGGRSADAEGTLTVTEAVRLGISKTETGVALEWLDPGVDVVLEETPGLEAPVAWAWVSAEVSSASGASRVVTSSEGAALFRLRRPE